MINKPKIIGVIQARMDSKRLPGKSLRLLRGKPMLEYILNNMKKWYIISIKRLLEFKVENYLTSMNIQTFMRVYF